MEIDFDDIAGMERAKEKKELAKLGEDKENKRWADLAKMSWIKRMQEPEFRGRLRRLEDSQRETFKHMIKKGFRELEPETLELFMMFWIDLLEEKCHDMNAWIRKYTHKCRYYPACQNKTEGDNVYCSQCLR